MEVSPHLKIRTPLFEITRRAVREGRENLEGVWEFAAEQCRPYGHHSGFLLPDSRSTSMTPAPSRART